MQQMLSKRWHVIHPCKCRPADPRMLDSSYRLSGPALSLSEQLPQDSFSIPIAGINDTHPPSAFSPSVFNSGFGLKNHLRNTMQLL